MRCSFLSVQFNMLAYPEIDEAATRRALAPLYAMAQFKTSNSDALAKLQLLQKCVKPTPLAYLIDMLVRITSRGAVPSIISWRV